MTVLEFPRFTKYGPNPNLARGRAERVRLAKLFAGKSINDMRALWDSFDDRTSFCGPYDCADVHSYMNMLGDGGYCATRSRPLLNSTSICTIC